MQETTEQYSIEISAIFQHLAENKKIISFIFILILALGTVTAFLLPPKYEFRQSITLANTFHNGTQVSIIPLDTIIKKIHLIYLQNAIAQYNTMHPRDSISLPNNVLIDNDQKTTIVISIKGIMRYKEAYATILSSIYQQIQQDTDPVLKVYLQNLNAYVSDLETQLAFQQNVIQKVTNHPKNLKTQNTEYQDLLQLSLNNWFGTWITETVALQNKLTYLKQELSYVQRTTIGSDLTILRDKDQISKSTIILLSLLIGLIVSILVTSFIIIYQEFIKKSS